MLSQAPKGDFPVVPLQHFLREGNPYIRNLPIRGPCKIRAPYLTSHCILRILYRGTPSRLETSHFGDHTASGPAPYDPFLSHGLGTWSLGTLLHTKTQGLVWFYSILLNFSLKFGIFCEQELQERKIRIPVLGHQEPSDAFNENPKIQSGYFGLCRRLRPSLPSVTQDCCATI